MAAAHPLVTIAIPVCGGAGHLGEAIDSALGQTWPATEVLVVANGSSDDGATRAVIDRYRGRVRALRNPIGGVATALNLALASMRGELFSWLSDDALHLPHKIDSQMAALARRGDRVPCFADADLIDAHGNALGKNDAGGDDFAAFPLWAVLAGRIDGCTMLVPRECFAACGGFDPSLPTTYACDLWFRLALRYPFAYLPETVARRRVPDPGGSRAADRLGEASLLLMELLSAIPRDRMVAYSGSERAFLERTLAFLRTSPHAAAAAGVEKMIEDLGAPAAPNAPSPGHAPRRDLAAALRRRLLPASVAERLLMTAGWLAHRHGPATARRLARAVSRLLAGDGLMDAEWYRRTYSDVAAAGVDPVLHFLLHGWREGRDPSASFSTTAYVAAHPRLGRGRKRRPRPGQEAAGNQSMAPGAVAAGPDRPWQRARPELPGLLFILHDHGGGTARFAAEIAAEIASFVEVVFLRGRGAVAELCRSDRGDDAIRFALPRDLDDLRRRLAGLGLCRVVVLHAMRLHDFVLPILDELGLPFDTVFLDYYLAVEQPHLAGEDGRFLGDDNLPRPVWPEDPVRRPLLDRADRLIACSEDLAGRLARLGISRPIEVAPPPEAFNRPRYRCRARPIAAGDLLRVVTLGTLMPTKGRDALVATAALARAKGVRVQFNVVGAIVPALPGAAGLGVMVHGAGADADLAAAICRIRPHLAWFPFQVPETHSYALSDAMAMGLPIVASAIGAVPARLAAWPCVRLVRFDASPGEWLEVLLRAATSGFPPPAAAAGGAAANADYYRTRFLAPVLAGTAP
jgi:glycosyltransferase involved in cell wall biosynthesis